MVRKNEAKSTETSIVWRKWTKKVHWKEPSIYRMESPHESNETNHRTCRKSQMDLFWSFLLQLDDQNSIAKDPIGPRWLSSNKTNREPDMSSQNKKDRVYHALTDFSCIHPTRDVCCTLGKSILPRLFQLTCLLLLIRHISIPDLFSHSPFLNKLSVSLSTCPSLMIF